MLCNSDLDPDRQMRYVRSLLQKNVEGIIMNSVANLSRKDIKHIEDSGVPVVLLNCSSKSSPFSTVCADNYRGGEYAARCFLKNGHRKLVHLTGPKSPNTAVNSASSTSSGKPAINTFINVFKFV